MFIPFSLKVWVFGKGMMVAVLREVVDGNRP
jgi:hypothetical protein